ncbi:MAG: peptidylprolyl isomerase [Syntrophorhabdaceae bacterium]|nr:peptidylprolyl isomerase [Syntrophorhabdaceae bacterium]
MKKLFIMFCIISSLFVLISCSKKENGTVVATVDGENITLQEFNRELDKIPANMKMIVATQTGKKNYLDRLIIKKLLLKEAKKEKIENDKDFQNRLAEIKEQLLIEAVLKKKIGSDTKISDGDLKKYYEANKESFKKDKEINTRHILVKTEEEAKQILSRLQKGDDFAELAKRFSIDPQAATTGGELGYHPKGTFVPEYEDVAFKLTKVGQLSGIVKSQFGYHIIRLEGIKQPTYMSFDEVKEFIKQRMIQEKQGELLEKYISDLKKEAKITIKEELLKDEKEKPVSGQQSDDKGQGSKQEKPESSEGKKTEPVKK